VLAGPAPGANDASGIPGRPGSIEGPPTNGNEISFPFVTDARANIESWEMRRNCVEGRIVKGDVDESERDSHSRHRDMRSN
jgi:hypothetical protein